MRVQRVTKGGRQAMTLFGADKREKVGKRERRVVVTGKRVAGTWTMESKIAPPVQRSASNEGVVIAPNRRVRTLH